MNFICSPSRLQIRFSTYVISDAPSFGRLWYGEPNSVSNAIDYAKFFSRSHAAVIHVYDGAGNVIETHEHSGEFKEWCPPRGAKGIASS